MSDHDSWNEVFHYGDTEFSWYTLSRKQPSFEPQWMKLGWEPEVGSFPVSSADNSQGPKWRHTVCFDWERAWRKSGRSALLICCSLGSHTPDRGLNEKSIWVVTRDVTPRFAEMRTLLVCHTFGVCRHNSASVTPSKAVASRDCCNQLTDQNVCTKWREITLLGNMMISW